MNRFPFPLIAACFLFATSLPAQTAWNVRDHIPLEDFTIQCHRGAGELSPENSLEAFEIAWKLSTIPEADLRMTKDEVIVAFHDSNFQRILPKESEEFRKKGIRDLTLEEVKRLDIGAWKGPEFEGQRVCTLEEICATLKKYPKRKVYIDIKQVDFVQLAEETEDVHPQLILASTNYREIRLWKKLAPKSQTLHWMGGTEQELTERLGKLELDNREHGGFRAVDQLQIHVRFDKEGRFSPSDEFLRQAGERLRKHGVLFQTLPWGGKDGGVYKRLMDLGVASFATDYPDVTIQAVREYYAEKR